MNMHYANHCAGTNVSKVGILPKLRSWFIALLHVGQWGSLGKHSLQTKWPLTHCLTGGVM